MTNVRVGFAEVDITPAPGLRTAGMPGAEPATGVHLPLYGRVALFDDGTRRAAIVVLDLLAIMAESAAQLRAAMAAAGGVAAGDILISCTHTHNGPQSVFILGEAVDLRYLQLVESGLVEAMAAAAARLEPVELRFGRAATESLTFNRRSILAGGEVASGGLRWVDEFVQAEGPADEELQLLFAVRSDRSIAGGLVGFSCHPILMSGERLYSADFVGALCEKLAQRHSGTFMFLQGAAGNLNPWDMSARPDWWPDDSSRPPEPGSWETSRSPAVELTHKHAEALLAASEAARSSSRPIVTNEGVRVASRALDIDQRSPTREQLELAYWFLSQDASSVDLDDFHRRITGHAYTFLPHTAPNVETWFARETIGMWWLRRGGFGPPAERVEVQVIAVGDVAFVGYPAEMFTEFGLRTKAESPFASTFVCELANGYVGYIPTEEAFEHGGYETRLAYSSRLVPHAGERMTDTALELLEEAAAPTSCR